MPIPAPTPRKASTTRRKPVENPEFIGKPDEDKFTAPRPIRDEASTPTVEAVTAPRYVEGKYVKQLEPLYVGVAAALGMFAPMTQNMILGDIDDDMNPAKEGEKQETIPRYVACARSVDELAKTSPRLRKTLDSMQGVGAMGMVVMTHTPIMAMAAAELGLFNQLGKLFKRKTAPEPQPTQEFYPQYDSFGNPVAA